MERKIHTDFQGVVAVGGPLQLFVCVEFCVRPGGDTSVCGQLGEQRGWERVLGRLQPRERICRHQLFKSPFLISQDRVTTSLSPASNIPLSI